MITHDDGKMVVVSEDKKEESADLSSMHQMKILIDSRIDKLEKHVKGMN